MEGSEEDDEDGDLILNPTSPTMGRRNRHRQNNTKTYNGDEAGKGEDKENAKEGLLYTCELSPIYGRYLETCVEIPEGTLLLKEDAVVVGPMRSSNVVCLGCHAEKSENREFSKCSKCSWPVCNEKCEVLHFHQPECKFFTEEKIKVPDYLLKDCSEEFGGIAVLRCLLLKLQKPAEYAEFMRLEAHSPIRSHLAIWKENEEKVVKVLREKWNLKNFFGPNEIAEIHDICGILEVNAFELGEKCSFRGVFLKSSMMAHDCIPNATHFESPKTGGIEVRAAVNIPPKIPITVSYSFALEGTVERRQMLLKTKFFRCDCRRCRDPSELGTHFSTLLCRDCGGHLMNIGANTPHELWECKECSESMSPKEVENIVNKFRLAAENIPTKIRVHEEFLSECKDVFHSTHFVPFGIKFNLCQAYGRYEKNIECLTPKELERKWELCTEVMGVLDVITPGLTVTRGLVLYELQAAEIIKVRRIFETRKVSKGIIRKRVENIIKMTEETIKILELSDEDTSEFKLATTTKTQTLPDLKRWLNSLK